MLQPKPQVQIRLGLAAGLSALLIVLVLTFVPDPLFRNSLFVTTTDNADGVAAGSTVAFRGGGVGKVRWIALDTARGLYNIGLSIRKDWPMPACAVVKVSAANPLTPPKVEIDAPPYGAVSGTGDCAAFRQTIDCATLSAPASAKRPIDGCLRQGDLVQLAAQAVMRATKTMAESQALLARLNLMVTGAGGHGTIDIDKLTRNVTETSTSLNAIASKLNATLTSERQAELGATIGNVRSLTGKAAAFDTAGVQTTVVRTNALLEQTTALLKENRESLQSLASQSAGAAAEGRELLADVQASMVASTTNLERVSANLDVMSERLKGDPTYALKGALLRDPPAPGAKP